MAAPTSLPLELVVQILDDLGGDILALQACALVHPAWVPTSQARLFHTVIVKRPMDWNSLIHLLHTSSHIRPLLRCLRWAIPWRSGVMAEPSPVLFPRVEHLVCECGPLQDALLFGLPSLVTLELCKSDEFEVDSALAQRIASPSSDGIATGARLAIPNLLVVEVMLIRDIPLAEWIQIDVQWQTLRSLTISIPELDDGPAYRDMLNSLKALEELTLFVCHHLAYRGSSILDVPECWSLFLVEVALGVVHASKLRLEIYPDEESVPYMHGILCRTSFPALRHLHIILGLETADAHRGRTADGRLSFDPTPTLVADDSTYPRRLQDWALPPSLTDPLGSVHVDLKGITEFRNTSAFLSLFGSANRSDILRLSSGGAQLLC
jgi:hypothetical protein